MDTIAQIMLAAITAIVVAAIGWIYAKYLFRFRGKVPRREEISGIALEEKMGELLAATGDKFASEVSRALDRYFADWARRIEEIDKEILASNIRMIYSSRAKALETMAAAIYEASSFVYIMGISLREFFQLDTPCSRAMLEVYHHRKDVKFKILILDNRSAEALDRSSREEGITFRDVHGPEYQGGTLFRETRNTIMTIQRRLPETALRVYDRQAVFLLITEKAVFMEPYHYGERSSRLRFEIPSLVRVAELVPLIEFDDAPGIGPYEQFLGHFEYVFDKAKEPTEANVGTDLMSLANGV